MFIPNRVGFVDRTNLSSWVIGCSTARYELFATGGVYWAFRGDIFSRRRPPDISSSAKVSMEWAETTEDMVVRATWRKTAQDRMDWFVTCTDEVARTDLFPTFAEIFREGTPF